MSQEFLTDLSNISPLPTNTKFLFGNVLAEHNDILNKLKALVFLNDSLLRDIYYPYEYFTTAIHDELASKLGILEVKNNLQPDLSLIPTTIPKNDVIQSFLSIVSGVDENVGNNTLLNVGDFLETDISIVDKSLVLDEKYLVLLDQNYLSEIIDIINNGKEEINTPISLANNILKNTRTIKIRVLKAYFGDYYKEFIEPLNNYQDFLEDNEIYKNIEDLKLKEKFLSQENIFKTPMAQLAYSDSEIYSKYFKRIFCYKDTYTIDFHKIFSDDIVAEQVHEIFSRCKHFINSTGSKPAYTNTRVVKDFTGVKV